MQRPFCLSSVYILAALTLSVPMLASAPELDPVAGDSEAVPEDICPAEAIDPALVGVWHRYDALAEGDRMRFYFFHEGGFGLYRYGKVGLTNTHSFDYKADGEALELTFRKTGERHRVPYHLDDDGDRTWLVLDDDPREVGGARYFKAPPQSAADCAWRPGLATDAERPAAPASGRIGGRLWGEELRYATGGMGFSIYQLQPQALDGRGVGWHHRGDYDEWTTETLTYRQRGDRLALSFPLRHDGGETAIAVTGAGDERRLHLEDDPRDFWRPHTYRDMGPTFAAPQAACLPQ